MQWVLSSKQQKLIPNFGNWHLICEIILSAHMASMLYDSVFFGYFSISKNKK